MSRRMVFGVLTPLLVVLHFFLHVGLSLERGAPDLLTLALLLAVRKTSLGWGGALGFLFGLMEDAFSVLAFGANTLALTVAGILGAWTRDLFLGDSLRFYFVYFSVGKLSRDLIHWIAAGATAREPFLNQVIVDGGLAAVYAAGIGLLLVFLLGGPRGLR